MKLGEHTPRSERDRRLTLLAREYARAKRARQNTPRDTDGRAARRAAARRMRETVRLMEREYARGLPKSALGGDGDE